MSSIGSRDRLLDAILGVLWAQWTELGVGGTKGTESSVVDPEALLLATSRFGRYDPRLFDEVLDWLAHHSAVLDVTRLRRLGAQHEIADVGVLAALVDFLRQRSTAGKWESSVEALVAHEDRSAYGGSTTLFLDSQGGALPTFGAADAFFLSHGLERPSLELRGLSRAPDARRAALGRLRLRALVGPGVRAEVLLYLATHDHAHGRLVATRSGFAQRQVAEYLSQLTAAGLAERWEDGRTAQYRLAPEFAAALGGLAPYVDWASAWSVITILWEGVGEAHGAHGDYAASKVWRDALERVRPLVPAEGTALPIPAPVDHAGERVLAYAEGCILRTVGVLEALAR
jgi:hypothetical protein